MKRLLAGLAVVVILAGCTHTTRLPREMPADTVQVWNGTLDGKTGWLIAQEREPLDGRNFRLAGDSVFWQDRHSEEPRVLPLADVKTLSVSDRRRGRETGFALGAAVGAGLGGIVGLLSSYSYDWHSRKEKDVMSLAADQDALRFGPRRGATLDLFDKRSSSQAAPVTNVVAGMFAGALVGGGVGILIGSETGYVIRLKFVDPWGAWPR